MTAKQSKSLQNLIYSAVFLALAYVLPFLTGQIPSVGKMLLPMHLPALLCGAEAVDKSWPAFWSVLRGLGAKVELNTDKQEEFDIKA